MIPWAGVLQKRVICGDVTDIYEIISSMTEADRDQLFIVPSRDMRSHQIKLVMVVPHTSGTIPLEILAKDIVNGRSLCEFRRRSTWKNDS